MQIGSADRFVMLKSCGYSRKEIVTVLKKTDIARQRRQRAGELSLFAVVQESFEYYKRAIANATIRRGTKQRERALVAEYKKPT